MKVGSERRRFWILGVGGVVLMNAVTCFVAVELSHRRVVGELNEALSPLMTEFGVRRHKDPRTIGDVIGPFVRMFEPLKTDL